MKRNCRLRLKLNENKDIIYIYMHVCELHWNKLCWIFISISWFFFMNSFFFVLFVWRLKNNSELRYIRYQILLLMCSWMIQSRLTSEVIDKSSENLNLRIWKLEKKIFVMPYQTRDNMHSSTLSTIHSREIFQIFLVMNFVNSWNK